MLRYSALLDLLDSRSGAFGSPSFWDTALHTVTDQLRRTQPLSRSKYRVADKSLARPTSRCILFDGENISFDAGLVICINSTNIPPIMIINRVYENQNLLSL